jgi:hypothetical protein
MVKRSLLIGLFVGALGAGLPSLAQAAKQCPPTHSRELIQGFPPPGFFSCVEAAPKSLHGLGRPTSPSPVHWYRDVIEKGRHNELLLPPGKVVPINFGGTTQLTDINGRTGNDVLCNKLDADATVKNPVGGGTGTLTLTSFSTSRCSQSGYCAIGEAVAITLKTLPLTIDTFEKPNGYRFSHWHDAFEVLCNGVRRGNIVGRPLLPYWSNGRYEVASPPTLNFDDGPGNGGEDTIYGKHYESQYGNTGNLELVGLGGKQTIQPKAYWYYLGYKRFRDDVIPTRSP